MIYTYYIAIGSNMGDRKKNLLDSIKHIEDINQTKLILVSKIYETDPVGFEDQDLFLNMAIKIESIHSPHEILNYLQKIETTMKRKRIIHLGPRTIDLDILLCNDSIINSESLIIPHPRMHERVFVLMPLKDIFPDYTYNGVAIQSLIKNCKDTLGVNCFRNS